MIGYVRGTIAYLYNDYCVVDVQGIGYRVFIPTSTRSKISLGKEITLHTYLHVREEVLSLFGFLTQQEHELFSQLMTVTGIGPKAALNILSAIEAGAFYQAIKTQDITILTKIPGIGKKTAERMILELKDKVKLDADYSLDKLGCIGQDNVYMQAVEALVSLGYSQAEVMPILKQFDSENSLEEILKLTLKELAKG